MPNSSVWIISLDLTPRRKVSLLSGKIISFAGTSTLFEANLTCENSEIPNREWLFKDNLVLFSLNLKCHQECTTWKIQCYKLIVVSMSGITAWGAPHMWSTTKMIKIVSRLGNGPKGMQQMKKLTYSRVSAKTQ